MDKLRYALATGLFLLICASGCAHQAQLWEPRTLARCGNSLGDPVLDRERTYLAALLALSSRQYAIVHSESPSWIEAESRSDYHPEVFHTRWVLHVLDNGRLEVDSPENAREMHDKTDLWYAKLSQSVALLACRDLNWLRWEAQNRGLLAVGAGLVSTPTSEGSAGGELSAANTGSVATPAQAPVALAGLPPSPGERAARQHELDRLRLERSDLHLFRTVAFAAVGAGMLAASIGLGAQALNQYFSCHHDGSDCVSRPFARGLGYSAAGSAAVGGVFLSVSLPMLFAKLPRYRALSHEMKALRDPSLSLGVSNDRTAWGLTLRGSF
jgi:hypothetical protein